jgi:hypothetical protein
LTAAAMSLRTMSSLPIARATAIHKQSHVIFMSRPRDADHLVCDFPDSQTRPASQA